MTSAEYAEGRQLDPGCSAVVGALASTCGCGGGFDSLLMHCDEPRSMEH